jgi:signal transduction histidine kinase
MPAQKHIALRSRPAAMIDAAIAAATLAVTLAVLAHGGIRPGSDAATASTADLDLAGVALAVCASLPLLAWRRRPRAVFVLTGSATALQAGLGYPLDLALAPAVALYLMTASRDQHTPWTPRNTVLVIALLGAYLTATAASHQEFPGSELVHSGLAWAVAWFAGERTRLRRLHIAELHERAQRTERDAERERLLAVAEERNRIARDLHDSAGHAISVIAVRAGAARLRHHQDPDRSRLALEAIEELARQTANEIDQIVGTLRQGRPTNGTIEAPPGLAALETLIERHLADGLDVTVRTLGAPQPSSGPVDQATYRILQEALTNAARHGAGHASVELAFDDAAIHLTVTNPVASKPQPRSGGGHGLIGMRERATLVGGDLDAGRANGTFRVHARIPYQGHHA